MTLMHLIFAAQNWSCIRGSLSIHYSTIDGFPNLRRNFVSVWLFKKYLPTIFFYKVNETKILRCQSSYNRGHGTDKVVYLSIFPNVLCQSASNDWKMSTLFGNLNRIHSSKKYFLLMKISITISEIYFKEIFPQHSYFNTIVIFLSRDIHTKSLMLL